MHTIYTNMDWKATPDYNPAKGTAGEPDANGIVKCEEGKVARTDQVEIHFSGDLSEENADKVRGYIKELKGTQLLSASTTRTEQVYVAEMKKVSTLGNFSNMAVGADGSTFNVGYYYDRSLGRDYRSDYLGGIARRAAGETNYSEAACQIRNMGADIATYFGSASSLSGDRQAVLRAYDDLLAEISQNIADSKEDPAAGLKTTVTVNGTKWNFAELLKTTDEINKSFKYFDTQGTLDYSDYAQLGVSKAKVMSWAKQNLSEDKQALVADSLKAREKTFILRERQSLENSRDIWDKPGVVITGEKAKYYDSIVQSASNKEIREKIMKLFEETDYDSPAAVSNTVNRYRGIMLPIFEAFCGSRSAAPDYVNSAVNSIFKYIAGLFGGGTAGGVDFSA